jgi:uncharacterized membrane protein YfcA
MRQCQSSCVAEPDAWSSSPTSRPADNPPVISNLPSWLDAALFTPGLLAVMVAAFLAGGFVKGTLGVGLPLVVVPLLSLVMPSPQAIVLVAVPVVASNLWQAIETGVSVTALRRFWPLLVTLLVMTAVTVPLTLALPLRTLNALLAIAVVTTVLLTALNPKLDISPRHERFASAGVGALAGVMGGVSSVTGPVIITYLMALKLRREEFVGSVSVIYLCSALPLYASMAAYGRFRLTELALSAMALLPLALGMTLGKRLRGRLSEVWFRRALLVFLSAIALALLLK